MHHTLVHASSKEVTQPFDKRVLDLLYELSTEVLHFFEALSEVELLVDLESKDDVLYVPLPYHIDIAKGRNSSCIESVSTSNSSSHVFLDAVHSNLIDLLLI